MEARFSKITYNVLHEAGWFPGRHVFPTVKLPLGIEIFEAARLILDEFGGLFIQFSYAQKTRIGSHLDRMRIIIDPERLSDENEIFTEYSLDLGHPLYPLGELDDQHYDLYDSRKDSIVLVDDLGRVFITSPWALIFIGENIDIALDNLLAGREGKIVDKEGHW